MYMLYADPERFRFARDTSFGRRHLSFWSSSPILLWIVINLINSSRTLQVYAYIPNTVTSFHIKFNESVYIEQWIRIPCPRDEGNSSTTPRLINLSKIAGQFRKTIY